jgi:uncharacterized protein YciI
MPAAPPSFRALPLHSRRHAVLAVLAAAALALAPSVLASAATAASAASDSAAATAVPAADSAEAAATAQPAAEATKPQQFVAVLRLVPRLHVQSAWTPADEQAVGRHFRRLQEGAAAGNVILAGRTQEPLEETFGLIVFEAADPAAARTWAEADPAVAAGVMTVEVHPYQVAIER